MRVVQQSRAGEGPLTSACPLRYNAGMTRIFIILASLSLLLLCTNIVLGLRIGDYNGEFAQQATVTESVKALDAKIEQLKLERPRPRAEIEQLRDQIQEELAASQATFAPIHNRAFVHMMFGIVASLVTLLVNSISITYFIGTSRWIREVVETYNFPKELIVEGNTIKRGTFPWALVGMLTVVGIIALGQAANPGIIRAGTASWVTPHLLGAMAGTALIGFAFLQQGNNIAKNYALIDRIVALVDEARRERGLTDDDEEAEPEKPIKPEFHDTVTG